MIHTLVQTLTDDVPLRGKVFMINFVAVAALAAHVAMAGLYGRRHIDLPSRHRAGG